MRATWARRLTAKRVQSKRMKRIYLDYAATTPTDPEVVLAMAPYYTESFGNPSAAYSCGQETRQSIETARENIAAAIGAHPEEIIFTSGGTESDNTALKGVARANRSHGKHIITTTIEHHAVLESCKVLEQDGYRITYIPTDNQGRVSPEAIRSAITQQTILVSVMHANNEVGSVQPIAEIGKIALSAGVLLHTDAVQTVGHLPVNINELEVDLLSCSAHKLYGPKGIGFLYIRKGTRIAPLIDGGSQEWGRRAGTENVPGIVGLAKAIELAVAGLPEEVQRQTALRDRLIAGLKERIPRVHLNGHPTLRLPNNINITVDHVEGEALLLNLDLAGVCVSTGSACSSGSGETSHVLSAIGVSPAQAHSSLRFSLGKWTTEREIDRLLEIMPPIVSRLRAMSPLTARIK
jgi:cysteine desulfurase